MGIDAVQGQEDGVEVEALEGGAHDIRIVVAGHTEVAGELLLARLEQRGEGPPLGVERAAHVGAIPDGMDLPEIDLLDAEALEAALQVLPRIVPGTGVRLGREEHPLASVRAKRLADAPLAPSAGVAGGGVEVGAAGLQRTRDDADALVLVAQAAERVAPETEERDLLARAPEGTARKGRHLGLRLGPRDGGQGHPGGSAGGTQQEAASGGAVRHRPKLSGAAPAAGTA